MMRTVKELREFIENIPDNTEVWGYEGEQHCIVFSNGKHSATFDNDTKKYDDPWVRLRNRKVEE